MHLHRLNLTGLNSVSWITADLIHSVTADLIHSSVEGFTCDLNPAFRNSAAWIRQYWSLDNPGIGPGQCRAVSLTHHGFSSQHCYVTRKWPLKQCCCHGILWVLQFPLSFKTTKHHHPHLQESTYMFNSAFSVIRVK